MVVRPKRLSAGPLEAEKSRTSVLTMRGQLVLLALKCIEPQVALLLPYSGNSQPKRVTISFVYPIQCFDLDIYHQTVIFDSCHSGDIIRGVPGMKPRIFRKALQTLTEVFGN